MVSHAARSLSIKSQDRFLRIIALFLRIIGISVASMKHCFIFADPKTGITVSVRVANRRFKNFSILNDIKFALTKINHLSLQSLSGG